MLILLTIILGGLVSFLADKTNKITNKIIKEDVSNIRELNRMLLSYRMARINLLEITYPGATLEKKETASNLIIFIITPLIANRV